MLALKHLGMNNKLPRCSDHNHIRILSDNKWVSILTLMRRSSPFSTHARLRLLRLVVRPLSGLSMGMIVVVIPRSVAVLPHEVNESDDYHSHRFQRAVQLLPRR